MVEHSDSFKMNARKPVDERCNYRCHSDFPEQWKGSARATADVLRLLRGEQEIQWTCLSPAAMLRPGTRTGKLRLGTDQLLANAQGESRISVEDYAKAMIDEVEKPTHIRRCFTVGY